MILLEKVHKWPSIKGPIVEDFLCLYNTKTGILKWGMPNNLFHFVLSDYKEDILNEPFAIAEQLENEKST